MKTAEELREISERNSNIIERTITDIGKKCEEQAKNGKYSLCYKFNQYQLKQFDSELLNDLIKILQEDYSLKIRIERFTTELCELEIDW